MRKHLESFDSRTAAGLDGVNVQSLKKIGTKETTLVLNGIIQGTIPEAWKFGRTSMIEKIVGAEDHGDFRPITVSSIWIRLLNKILAEKIELANEILSCQKGFQKRDGVAEAVNQLTRVFRGYKKNAKPFAIALIDFSKAFDSVSHQAIVNTLERRKVPKWIREYVSSLYSGSSTLLDGTLIRPKRGIRQGDQLSPLLFNLVLGEVLRTIPEDFGLIDGPNQRVSTIAYADDLLLAAEDLRSLQHILRRVEEEAAKLGLKINAKKSRLISWTSVPKQKKIVCRDEDHITTQAGTIRQLKDNEIAKYLGVNFNRHGITTWSSFGRMKTLLEKITKAPLKPQQRLHLLTAYVQPKLYHQGSFSSLSMK